MSVRQLLLRHPLLAIWFAACALSMKLAMPVGFMPSFENGAITVELCAGQMPAMMTMAMPHGGSHHDGAGHGKPDAPCGFSGLSAQSLGGADPILLALAVAFVMAMALHPRTVQEARQRGHLRPPLRGPPLTA